MDKAITQALHGLVPSLSGPLPQELVDLASSLLAQSRGRASNLKAEEETARTHACANIACERLKRVLYLPKIEPRPPCPPRVYKKLYEHLDKVLASKTKRSHTTAQGSQSKSHANPDTPRKSGNGQAVTPSRSTATRTVASRSKVSKDATDSEPPSWIMRVIRQLCKRLNAPKAPPHVFTGISTILASVHKGESLQVGLGDINLASLLAAVTFFVSTRLYNSQSDHEKLVENCQHAVFTCNEARKRDHEIPETSEQDIRAHMRMIAVQKWISMEWFRNIKVGSAIGDQEAVAGDSNESQSEDRDIEVQPVRPSKKPKLGIEEAGGEYLRPGLGTMMQAKVDFLSDESVARFEEWKEGALAQIADMKRQANLEQRPISAG